MLAILAVLMPWRWMGRIHEALGMGELPDKPIVEYLARSTSGLCALYGGLLLLLATDVRRYERIIRFHAVTMMSLSLLGAVLGLRAGMPEWWMIADAVSVSVFCVAMLVAQRRMRGNGAQHQPARL
jgi:uncharacterized membrane protein